MPMPLDVVVSYADGTQETFYIPLEIMRGEKKESISGKRTVLSDWPWVYPEYGFTISRPVNTIRRVVIDPSFRIADVNPENNVYPALTEIPRLIGTSK
jgi:hypothetical protein